MNKNLLKAFGEKGPRENVEDLLRQSSSATCAIMEREIVVKNEDVSMTKQRLKSKGFMIIGTSEPNGNTRKIWFIRRGGF